jgi:hypothetical protein
MRQLGPRGEFTLAGPYQSMALQKRHSNLQQSVRQIPPRQKYSCTVEGPYTTSLVIGMFWTMSAVQRFLLASHQLPRSLNKQ